MIVTYYVDLENIMYDSAPNKQMLRRIHISFRFTENYEPVHQDKN